MLIDRNGKWRINTLLKGFAKNLSGLASSFSHTGDIILIGKNKQDILKAFDRMKEIGGGIVIAENGEIVKEIPLPLKGLMSNKTVEELIIDPKGFVWVFTRKGLSFCRSGPFITIFFVNPSAIYSNYTSRECMM